MTTEERLEALEKRMADLEAVVIEAKEQKDARPSWEATHRKFVEDIRKGTVLGG